MNEQARGDPGRERKREERRKKRQKAATVQWISLQRHR